MIELVHFKKFNGFLTKRISLTETGTMTSDGSECVMYKGTAHRLILPDHHALAEHIHHLKPYEAIALGALVPTVTAAEARVVTKAVLQRINGHATTIDVIARTADYIKYRDGKPAFALIDIDTKGMPPDVRDRVKKAGGYWNAIVSAAPDLAKVARVVRNSTSSCISRSDTGEAMPGSEGVHIYLPVTNGGDTKRFLKALHDRLWLAGFGWYHIGKGAQFLERSLVDVSVCAGERLVFEGPPAGRAAGSGPQCASASGL